MASRLSPPSEALFEEELLALLTEKGRVNMSAIRALLIREEQRDPRTRALALFEEMRQP
jgi:hypothetical protein